MLDDLNIGVQPERIRRAVEATGGSTVSVARSIGLHQSTLQQWMSGEKTPSARNLALLAKVTGYSVGYFFGEDDGVPAEIRHYAEIGRQVSEMMMSRQRPNSPAACA
jgi:transcriptional regulator with XRE-family HTH domain